MSGPEIQEYRFGPYRIDSGERLLHRADELVSLPPKAIDTLLVLVASAGRMVDKGDLMKAVWPDTFVEEGALTRNISVLRKAFGDTGDEASYIETIPKRGYRFVTAIRAPAAETAPIVATEDASTAQADAPVYPARPSAMSTWVAKRAAQWAAPAGVLLLVIVVALYNYVSHGREAIVIPV